MAGELVTETVTPRVVEQELDVTRDRLGVLLDELSRRRHDLGDIGHQVRRHMVPVAVAAGVVGAAVALAIGLGVRHRRERKRLRTKAGHLRSALGRMVAHPERVARDKPNFGAKLLVAIASTAATVLIKRLGERAIPPRRQAAELIAASRS